ncbi:MAG: OmpH family outer membrane protein [Bacteroidota bacterium]
MNMKKLAVAGAMLLAGTFGAMGLADAATGIVNVNAVLSGNAAFQKAGKTVAAEQQKLQKEYNEKSKDMNDADKKALEQKLNQQLAQKENEVMKPIQDNFKAAVEKAAKAKKIDTVVVPGGIIYGAISADLTEDVKANMK